MPDTFIKLPLPSASPIKAIMLVFKTAGLSTGSEYFLTIPVNGRSYQITMAPKAGDSSRNILSLLENGSYSTDGREAVMYINGKQAPINTAKISLNEWTSLIIQFKTAATFYDNGIRLFGAIRTTVGIFSSYSQPIDAKRESVVYNFWDDINNVNWYNYYSNGDYWQDVFAEITDISSKIGTDTIWDTFLGRNTIVQAPEVISADNTIILQMGNYEYETYSDTIKESIYRSPA